MPTSTRKTDETKFFIARPSLPLRRMLISSSFALLIPVNVTHSRAQKYMGTVTVDAAGRCWLHCGPSVGLQLMSECQDTHLHTFMISQHTSTQGKRTGGRCVPFRVLTITVKVTYGTPCCLVANIAVSRSSLIFRA